MQDLQVKNVRVSLVNKILIEIYLEGKGRGSNWFEDEEKEDTWFDGDGGADWDYGGGNSGSSSSGNGNSNNENVDIEIINNLTGKAKCVYDHLLKSGVRNPSNLITKLFIEFGTGNIGNNDLTFKMDTNLSNSTGGKTRLNKDSGDLEILINANLMDKLSSIEIAAILVHEISHAFLGKHYNNYNTSFKEIYSQYINDKGLGNYSHDIMKDQFINRMATVLQNYANQIFPNFDDYKILASQGVFDLNPSQKHAFNTITTKARNNDTKCKN